MCGRIGTVSLTYIKKRGSHCTSPLVVLCSVSVLCKVELQMTVSAILYALNHLLFQDVAASTGNLCRYYSVMSNKDFCTFVWSCS